MCKRFFIFYGLLNLIAIDCFGISNDDHQIKILFTSALLNQEWAYGIKENCYESRKNEYIMSLNILRNFGYEPYVVEAIHKESPSFFEEYTRFVFYSNVNDMKLRNKGVNEAKSMMEGFNYYGFDDNDMIIKMTGRYRFKNRDFLNIVESYPEADAIIKCDRSDSTCGYILTGCFALRCKFFKEFLNSLDFIEMEEDNRSIEVYVATYIRYLIGQSKNVMFVENLGLTANIGGNCPPVNHDL